MHAIHWCTCNILVFNLPLFSQLLLHISSPYNKFNISISLKFEIQKTKNKCNMNLHITVLVNTNKLLWPNDTCTPCSCAYSVVNVRVKSLTIDLNLLQTLSKFYPKSNVSHVLFFPANFGQWTALSLSRNKNKRKITVPIHQNKIPSLIFFILIFKTSLNSWQIQDQAIFSTKYITIWNLSAKYTCCT